MPTLALDAPDTDDEGIRAAPRPTCHVCGGAGRPLYDGVTDRLFGSRGEWDLKRCSDRRCGLLWLDPMPIEADLPKAYRRYYTHASSEPGPPPPRSALLEPLARAAIASYQAERYGIPAPTRSPMGRALAFAVRLSPLHRATVDAAVLYLRLVPNGRVLDVGCGSGALVTSLNALGWRAEGVDSDPRAVAAAHARGVTVRAGTIADIPSSSFDAIVMSHVIEHVADPLATLRECRRVLKPGGRLVLVTPNVRSLGHRLLGRDWLGLDPPRHLHVFTAEALCAVVGAAGLSDVAVRATLHAAEVFVAGSWMLRRSSYTLGAPVPRRVQLGARLVQGLEWVLSWGGGAWGEVLVSTSRR